MNSLIFFIGFIGAINCNGDMSAPIIIRKIDKGIDGIFVNEVGFTPPFDMGELPPTLDWRKKGVVLPVQNQGKCGQSEVINALDAISAAHTIETKKPLLQLSQQQIYDCSTNPHWCPCGASGNATNIYNYILSHNNQSIDTEQSYPYTGKCVTQCGFKSANTGATLLGYAFNIDISEDILLILIQTGPVAAEVNASPMSFQLYAGGVYEDPKCTADQVSHSLLVVGYDEQSWFARNSWGMDWGEEGYIRIARNKGNICGIATKLAVPVIVQ